MAKPLKKILKSNFASRSAGWIFGASLWLVYHTSKKVYEPADLKSDRDMSKPVIFVSWHGHSYMAHFMFKRGQTPTLMVARHGDGRMAGYAMAFLGGSLVYGSGSNNNRPTAGRGGAVAFLKLLKLLRNGTSVAMSADVPKIARKSGEGALLLARKSGYPVVPVAMATSRRSYLSTWDKMVIHKPWSRLAFVEGAPIFVPDDDSPLEDYQQLLEEQLNATDARALALADGAEPQS